MIMTIRLPDPTGTDYARDYRAGWRAGEQGTEGALERADARGVSHAWYDGYHDAAAGRAKWTLRAARLNPEHWLNGTLENGS